MISYYFTILILCTIHIYCGDLIVYFCGQWSLMWEICLDSKSILLAVLSKRKAEVQTNFNLGSDPFR